MKLSDLSRATDTRLGKVEKATTTEAEAGTADKYPDAAGVRAHGDARYSQITDVDRRILRESLLKEATLNLDFANNRYEVYEGPVDGLTAKPFNDIVTFTRASAASARNAIGGLSPVLTDQQRLVGNREGLLIEEQRVNAALWSEDFTNAIWVKTNVTPTANTDVSPDGTVTADNLVSTAAGATVIQTLGNSAPNGGSFYIKNKAGNGIIDLTLDGNTWVSFTVTSEMARYFVNQSGTQLGIRFPASGQEVAIWGGQAE